MIVRTAVRSRPQGIPPQAFSSRVKTSVRPWHPPKLIDSETKGKERLHLFRRYTTLQ
jgi:hypothetical protein